MQVLMNIASVAIVVLLVIFVLSFMFAWGYKFKGNLVKAQHIKEHTGPHKHPVPETTQIIGGKRYSSMDSKCIAQGATAMGWAWLMQTNNNNYFIIAQTILGLQGIFPQSKEEAIAFHTSSNIREVSFEQAFPNEKVIDA